MIIVRGRVIQIKYSNNAVKCITTILALNLTAIKGTSNVNCSSYWETLSLYAHCNLISFLSTETLTALLCRMQYYTIHHSLHYQSKKSMLICTHDIVVNSTRRGDHMFQQLAANASQ